MLKNLKNKAANKAATLGSLALVSVGNAVAAVPGDVSAAIADMKSDGITVATAFLVAGIAIAAFLFMRKGAKG